MYIVAVAILAFTPFATTHNNNQLHSVTLTNASDRDNLEIRDVVSPSAPKVGETYSLIVTVKNKNPYTRKTTVVLVSWPKGDQPTAGCVRTLSIDENQTRVFVFPMRCGVEGGTLHFIVE